MHTLKKGLKMGTDKHPQPLQVLQTLPQHQIQQTHPAATHKPPKPARKQPPSTWGASAHRNGLLFFWAAGGRCKCGSLSESSELLHARQGGRVSRHQHPISRCCWTLSPSLPSKPTSPAPFLQGIHSVSPPMAGPLMPPSSALPAC